MEFWVREWSRVLHSLDHLCNLDAHTIQQFPSKGPEFAETYKALADLGRDCMRARLEQTADFANELLGKIAQVSVQYTAPDVQRDMQELKRQFERETKNCFLLVLDSDNTLYYAWNEQVIFNNTFANNFSTATYDASHAGRCLAIGSYTASVFHLMCVLERGLSALARALSVPSEHSNWDNIINQIEARIKDIEKGINKTDNWQDDKTFYANAALQFRHFKDAWRNHVIHGREHYDDTRAKGIYSHVAEFMNHLATRLSDKDV
jgi:hypothetical protein